MPMVQVECHFVSRPLTFTVSGTYDTKSILSQPIRLWSSGQRLLCGFVDLPSYTSPCFRSGGPAPTAEQDPITCD